MQTLTEEFKKEYGIAEVLNCFDTSGQKIVYIIVNTDGDKFAMKSFRNCTKRDIQEIEILNRFKEISGIATIARIEEYNGAPIIFEEFIDAPDLEDIIKSYKGDEGRISTLMENTANILQPVWEDNIVHRDLKPKNIKILDGDQPVILDFGIARDLATESITETGEDQPMTWNYASPEQYRKDKKAISYRTDFFVLGIIAYVLYYQSHPFGNTREEVEQKFTQKDNTIYMEDGSGLNTFFQNVLVIDPSGRPRDIDSFISCLH